MPVHAAHCMVFPIVARVVQEFLLLDGDRDSKKHIGTTGVTCYVLRCISG